MISVQRRVNSTQRIRITRDRVTIMLEPPVDITSFAHASASINLMGLNFPTNAEISLEAYYRSSSMRFECGTVGKVFTPARMELSDVDLGGAIQFRLLVVDRESGRILGSAEGLRPANSGESPDRQPLLPVRETNNLGHELWRIDIDERNGPVLCVNNAVPGLAAQIRSLPLVQGLVLPHAFRMILRELSAAGGEEGDDLWGDGWRTFLRQLGIPTEPENDDDDTREEWIQSAVTAFCELKDFVSRVRIKPATDDGGYA